MSQEVFQIIQGMDLKNIETQFALQCAPLITGLKISNLLIVQNDNAARVKEILKGTGIVCFVLHVSDGKTIFLLYKEREMKAYLSQKKVRTLLAQLGYRNYDLKSLLILFRKRYKMYANGEIDFPHEMGLFLGYPVEDVHGFIENTGKNFLHSGYWKVYKNLPLKMQLFQSFERARERVIQLTSCGMSIREIINIYSEAKLQRAVV
ncbi:DUF3793 family protein [Anaerocolumna sp.]|uniref:DUF3793 family protein n=1 Tax=Anaerocolumna sp. TaxID=2041569 RepID=UPI0028AB79C0|nr:DUF3793 family protein [Anaerocolumna sp.]